MSKPRPFLNTPYGAYLAREVPPPDDELVRVGPGTPCGEYLRRFWQPVAFARDLKDVPLRIRIMSEDLVIFRDKRGSVGLLQLNCAHRGTSLEYGLVSERGIRCCYHGWLYDVDGRILETPGEPASSTLKDRLCQGAYPVHEYCGLIFAYMGPPEKKPAFPLYDTFDLPGLTLMPAGKFALPCNWLQIKDNSMDPGHPADYDAQSSQREIAVHALEHLASTDRGVLMLRKIVRDGIRAVAAGSDPKELLRAPGPPIATACQDRVLRIPPEKDAEADKRLLRETGRKVARGG